MSHDPHHSERATYTGWLADPANAQSDGRERIQAALDRLPPVPGSGPAHASAVGPVGVAQDVAAQILATAGIAPRGEPAMPRTEAEAAAQILAAANLTRVSSA